jgi:hypothetical protein
MPAMAGSAMPAPWSGRRTTKIMKCALPEYFPRIQKRHIGRKPPWEAVSGLAGQHRSVFAAVPVLTRGGSTLGGVRLTEFWDRMNAQFGDVYAQSVAKDFVFDQLGGRTVERALADGVDAKAVWRAVCETFKVPESLR